MTQGRAAELLPEGYQYLEKYWGDAFSRDERDALQTIGVLPVIHAILENAGGLIPLAGSKHLWEPGKELDALRFVDDLAILGLGDLLAYAESGQYHGHLNARCILARSVLAEICQLSGSQSGAGINQAIFEPRKDQNTKSPYLSLVKSGVWKRPYWSMRITQVASPESDRWYMARLQKNMLEATVLGLREKRGDGAVDNEEVASMVCDLLIAVTNQAESYQDPDYLQQIINKLHIDSPQLPGSVWGKGIAEGLEQFMELVHSDKWQALAPTLADNTTKGELVEWVFIKMTSFESHSYPEANTAIYESVDRVAAMTLRASQSIPTDDWPWIALRLFDTPQESYPLLLAEIRNLWAQEDEAHRREFYRVVPPLAAGIHRSEIFHAVMDMLEQGGRKGLEAQLGICNKVMEAARGGSGKAERIPKDIVERARSTIEAFTNQR